MREVPRGICKSQNQNGRAKEASEIRSSNSCCCASCPEPHCLWSPSFTFIAFIHEGHCRMSLTPHLFQAAEPGCSVSLWFIDKCPEDWGPSHWCVCIIGHNLYWSFFAAGYPEISKVLGTYTGQGLITICQISEYIHFYLKKELLLQRDQLPSFPSWLFPWSLWYLINMSQAEPTLWCWATHN